MFRHSNPVWKIFILIFATGAFFYTGMALFQIMQYSSLTTLTQPSKTEWKVVPNGSKFAVQVQFAYLFNGKSYERQEALEPYYLNPWAAEEALSKLKVQLPPVWIDPSSPQNSVMEKKFPLKTVIYAACLWLLFTYLLYIDRYGNI
ncbi:MAG: hypothetical protein LW832_10405 [Parachlamydia sp.]|nr:hypothetical protein [Parachlamydia sp.]